MRKLKKGLSRILLLAIASSSLVGVSLAANKVGGTNNSNSEVVNASDVPVTRFNSLTMKQHDGSASTPLRIIIGATTKGNNSKQESHPTWWSNQIRVFDTTAGQLVNPSMGINGYSGVQFMFEIKDPSEWESGHRYVVEFPQGLVIDSGVKMAETQYLEFQIYVNSGKTAFCFDKMFGKESTNNAYWTYNSSDSNKVEVVLTNPDSNATGISISNVSVDNITVGDTEGFIYVDSSAVNFGSDTTHKRFSTTSNCNLLDLNYWSKMKFSNDGTNWIPAAFALNMSYDKGAQYFNQSSNGAYRTYQFSFLYGTGIGKATAEAYKYIKFEQGTQLPHYGYMSGSDSTNKCLILDHEVIIRKGDANYKWSEIVFDPTYDAAPTLYDYGGGFTSNIDQFNTENNSAQAFFNLSTLTNRTLDLSFEWQVKGSSGSDAIKLVTNYDSQDGGESQTTWFYRSSSGLLRVAEIGASNALDKPTGFYANINDIVRVRYIRTYASDRKTYTASTYINGYPSPEMNVTYSVKDAAVNTSDKLVIMFRNTDAGGRIRSVVDAAYALKTYSWDVLLNGTKQTTVSVSGGKTFGEVVAMQAFKTIENEYTITGYKNELGFNVNGSLSVMRNGSINVIAVRKAQLTFNSNGGDTTYDSVLVQKGTTYSELANMTPDKDGYMFDGWKNGDTLVTSSTVINEDMTLTASWKENLTFTEFGYWRSLNQCGKDQNWRIFTLRFNGIFSAPESGTERALESSYEIGNHMYLNGVSFRTLGQQNKAHLWWYPGDASSSYSNANSISFAIDETYLTTLNSNTRPIVSIDENTRFGGMKIAEHKFGLYEGEWKVYTFGSIETLPQASLKEFNGEINSLSFETRFDYYDFSAIRENSSEIQFGTYIVVANSFKSSSYATVGQYIENTAAGSKTYVDVVNTGKDFINESTAQSDGYYAFKGSLTNIKDGNIAKNFIPVGYVRMGGTTYYGQTGSYSANLFETLVANKSNSKASALLAKFSNVISLSNVEGTYKFTLDYSNNPVSITASTDGSYAVTPSTAIDYMIIDHEAFKVNMAAGATKYIQKGLYGVTMKDAAETFKNGFAEPTHELWPTDTNQASYNTASNNAMVCQLMGAKSMRVWISIGNLVASNSINWPSIGLVTRNINGSQNEDWGFDSTLVNNLRSILQSYRNAGVEEITLLSNDFVRDGNSHFMTAENGDRVSLNEGVTRRGDWVFSNTFPDKYVGSTSVITDEYSNFLSMNAKFFKLIGDNFGDLVTSVESMNEINLRPFDYDVRYADDNYLTNLTPNSDFNDAEFLAERSMDYCKAMTDGIKASGANIKVLTPSISPVGDSNSRNYSKTVGDTTYGSVTFNFKRRGTYYLEACMDYIEDKCGSRFNDYFQGLNLHPYLFTYKDAAGIGNNAYVYETNKGPHYNVGFENQTAGVDYNANYDEDFGADIDVYHNILENHGDYNVPVYLTEYGVQDISENNKYWASWDQNGFYEDVVIAIYNQIASRSYIKAAYWYRIFDHTGGEKDFGVVDRDGQIKQPWTALYYCMNGTAYSGSSQIVNP